MNRRLLVAFVAWILALTLIGAPVTMADWGEQAFFGAEPVEESQLDEDVPILEYDELSASARDAVGRAIESPDGSHVVYGTDDWPEEFTYTDCTCPGRGRYAVDYEGRLYEVTTHGGGGFPAVFLVLLLPFVCYGFVLLGVALSAHGGTRSPRMTALLVGPAVAFHALGPALDFPLLDPMAFVALGIVATVGALIGLAWDTVRSRRGAEAR